MEYSLHTLGVIAALLLLGMALSPLRRLLAAFDDATSKTVPAAFYAFLYALLFAHFYVGWSAEALASEFASRPYILWVVER